MSETGKKLWRDLIETWGLKSLKISAGFLDLEFAPNDADRKAAWELYVELLTRVATQYLAPDHGDEKTALDSIHALFGLTREILKSNPGCLEFAKLSIVALNQVIRPFTAKWHRLSLAGAFTEPTKCHEFRQDLSALQSRLRLYTVALSQIAQVEDLTQLEPAH